MKRFFILFVIVLVLFSPETADAQGIFGGVCSGVTCSACHIAVIANTLISWLIGMVMVLFAVLIVWAGFGLVTSGGNPTALTEAKSKFTNAFIGLIIVLSAWLIVDTLMRGLVGNNGEIEGYGPWSQIQCTTQTAATTVPGELDVVYLESEIPDLNSSITQAPGTFAAYTFNTADSCQTLVTRSFSDPVSCAASLNDLKAASLAYIYQDCEGIRASGNEPSWYGAPTCGVSGAVVEGLSVNENMQPIFDPAQGGSSMVKPGAAGRMQSTLSGPFTRLQQSFGRQVVINDAIAKSGTSRETNTPGSRHFYGDALDLSTAGMSNADKLRLFRAAKSSGFQGFGFGNNILHVDLGAKRAWAYGNSSYGGVSISQLKAEAIQ